MMVVGDACKTLCYLMLLCNVFSSSFLGEIKVS